MITGEFLPINFLAAVGNITISFLLIILQQAFFIVMKKNTYSTFNPLIKHLMFDFLQELLTFLYDYKVTTLNHLKRKFF